jgi:glycosyltransferase involved in cell wall biosynthesis
MAYSPPGWRQKLHYAGFVAWVLLRALRWRPHWVYASDLLSCPAAWLLSFLPGQRIVYHEHDSPPAGPTSRFLRWCLAARRRLAHRAVVNVLPNAERARRFAEQTGATNVQCVWNCPRLDEVSVPRSPADGRKLRVVYHGSIVPARLPPAVIEALAQLPDPVLLRVVGYETVGSTGYCRRLADLAERLGVRPRIEFCAAMPRDQLLPLAGQCDVGLAWMPLRDTEVDLTYMVRSAGLAETLRRTGLRLGLRPGRPGKHRRRLAMVPGASRADARDGRGGPAAYPE